MNIKDIEIIDLSDEEKKVFKDAVKSLSRILPLSIKNTKNIFLKYKLWKFYKILSQ